MTLFRSLALCALTALPVAADILPAPTQVQEGSFGIDLGHTRLTFRVSHLGFSMYTAFFTDIDATLAFDPATPEAMTLNARVGAGSVETLYHDPAMDFNAIVAGTGFLDAAAYPDITFNSTSVRLTAPDQAAVTGDLTLHGVTRPITLRVTFNGGYQGHPLDPGGARIGFSAHGTIYRSDFGMAFGIPAPGTTMGVGDMVEIVIETEFTNPDATGPQPGP